jgi:hypothetical protein
MPHGVHGKPAATCLWPLAFQTRPRRLLTPQSLHSCIWACQKAVARVCCAAVARSLAQRIHLFVDPEVSRSRKARPLPCDMDDQRIEWRKSPFRATGVKALHEQRDELGLATKMQVLRWGEPSSVKDS